MRFKPRSDVIHSKKISPVLGTPIPVLGMKVKRDKNAISLFLKINFQTTISMKMSRREFSINMVIVSLKITTLLYLPVLPPYPKQAWDYQKQELFFTVYSLGLTANGKNQEVEYATIEIYRVVLMC